MMYKRTKIVATIGPACESKEILEQMVRAGVNVARLNFSHGTYKNYEMLIKNIREVEDTVGEPVAIMQDLQGPRIRLGNMPEKGVLIKSGEKIIINTHLEEYKKNEIPVTYPGLESSLTVGEHFLIDDGHMELEIIEIKKGKLIGKVIEGGILLSHKGLNFPDSVLRVPVLSEKDKEDLRFGIKMGIDLVALSFVHTAQDILNLRDLIRQYEKEFKIKKLSPILIIAKIERHEAIEHIDEIIAASDGLMVARGDLGLEMPAAEVPLMQKMIITKSNLASKPVIVATQMLDSMQHNRRPTRAEVSDVANAVIDHADAVMLSNETASGAFPVLTVKTMANIIHTTEKSHLDRMPLPVVGDHESTELAITELSRVMAQEVGAKLIIAASISGDTGRLIARVRPTTAIIVATNTKRVWRQLNLSWGVKSFVLSPCDSLEELVDSAVNYVKVNKIAKTGDKMIVVAGEPVGETGKVNILEVREVK